MAATFPLDTSQPWTYNGVTYKYDAAADMWYAVSSEGSTQLADDLDDLEERVDQIESGGTGGPALTYQIQTNQITGTPDPSLDLISSEDEFTNVKFEGADGITVSSTASSIVISGGGPQANPDDYYTALQVDDIELGLQNQIDELLVTKGEPTVYTLNGVGIQVGIRPGDFYVDNGIVKNISFIALAPQDDNGKERPLGEVGDILEIVSSSNATYRYEITTAADGLAGVVFELGSDPDALLVPGQAYSIYIYPQNKATASIEYVNSQLDGKLSLTGGDLTGDLNSTGNINLGGNLAFTNGGQIIATSGNTVLSGRASLEIKSAADYPVVISSGSSYKKVLAFYGYDGGQVDNRGEVAYINANGNAYFTTVFASNEELATQAYVDNKVAGKASVEALAAEDAEPDIYYSDSAPTQADDGDLWVDSDSARLLIRVAGAWINPDREGEIALEDYKKVQSPAGRRFKFYNGTTPAYDGQFAYFEEGGQLKLRIRNVDTHDMQWNDGGIRNTLNVNTSFSIVQWQNNTHHKIIRNGTIDSITYEANHITCMVDSHSTNGSLSSGSNYFITIGGVF